ncbi:macrophage mannose receptor 1-like [Nematolebias whitei]|uniref:macrophage mannose receptor 1-like n=1 Tax=Nematolebias whitei TaxID=451745 RepID=UPI0018992577|nr:macrophage mannose receptor 1-like [Nematolebias whitei]
MPGQAGEECSEGPCVILSLQSYEYHFINEEKTWDEAQMYCQEYFTDLAAVHDEEDQKRLTDSTDFQDKVILIQEKKTWEEALHYCRAHHQDLVTITDSHQQKWAQKRATQASSTFVWLGLRYTCVLDLWFWVSDEAVNYKKWGQHGQFDQCEMCGAMDREGHHEWYSRAETEKFNFICTR